MKQKSKLIDDGRMQTVAINGGICDDGGILQLLISGPAVRLVLIFAHVGEGLFTLSRIKVINNTIKSLHESKDSLQMI